jgi:ketosteroid isomerase-like protein
MSANDQLQTVRDSYTAYESGDRAALERVLSEDFTFFSPPDPGIDLATYWQRCWPNSERLEKFEFVRLVEADDEVIVTYEATRVDGSRFRNTEVHTFAGNAIARVEVYFGWDLE